jgi:hypothetical protein
MEDTAAAAGESGTESEPDDDAAPYAWVCTCGWESHAWGRDREWIPPLQHMKLKDGQQHRIMGLVDRRTGETIFKGLNSTGFMRRFGVGKFAPRADVEPVPGKGGKGGSRSGNGTVVDLPTRRLRVLAQDVEVSDVVTTALHLVARRLPELVPPELLQGEATYARTMSSFLEHCVLVTLDQLTQRFPDRFSPQDLNLAIIAGEAQRRLNEIGGD